MRLIDADTLIESMALENAVKWGNKDGYQQDHSYSTLMRYEIKREIDCQPTVDAVPVVHGRWEDPQPEGVVSWDKRAYAQCSVCKAKEYLARKKKYCPNCGARMDGETDDHG